MAKGKGKKQQKASSNFDILKQIKLNAAGIDVGSEAIYVSVPEDRDDQAVRSFASFTSDLYELARWLKACKIDTVAMEATSVY